MLSSIFLLSANHDIYLYSNDMIWYDTTWPRIALESNTNFPSSPPPRIPIDTILSSHQFYSYSSSYLIHLILFIPLLCSHSFYSFYSSPLLSFVLFCFPLSSHAWLSLANPFLFSFIGTLTTHYSWPVSRMTRQKRSWEESSSNTDLYVLWRWWTTKMASQGKLNQIFFELFAFYT